MNEQSTYEWTPEDDALDETVVAEENQRIDIDMMRDLALAIAVEFVYGREVNVVNLRLFKSLYDDAETRRQRALAEQRWQAMKEVG